MAKHKDLFNEPNSAIGQYNKDLFSVDTGTEVEETIVKDGINYDEFLDKYNKPKEVKKAKTKETQKSNLFSNPLDAKKVEEVLPIVTVSKPKLHKEDIFYGYLEKNLLDIKEVVNTITLAHVVDSKLVDNLNIACILENGTKVYLELIGFSSKFEAVFQIYPAIKLTTGGNSRLYQNGKDLYLNCNVNVFEKDENIIIKLNNKKYEFRFKELNTLNNNIKKLDVFNIKLNDIKEL